MWKKIWIALLTFVGISSFGYIYYANELFAATSYQAGGNITGRVNKAPTGITGSHIGMRKGDKLYLGLQNEDGTELPFQLLYKINNYTKYSADGSYGSYSFPNSAPKTSWISGSLHPYGNKTTAFKDGAYTMYIPWNPAPYEYYGSYYMPDYTDSSTSILYPKLKGLNNQIDSLSYKDKLIGYRDLTNISKYYSFGNSAPKVIFDQAIKADEIGQHAYLFNVFELDYLSRVTSGIFNYPGLYGPDSAFIDNYWLFTFAGGSDLSTNGAYYVNGSDGSISSSGQTVNTTIAEMNIRPFLNIDTDHIVFAVSNGTKTSIGKVDSTTLSAGYTNIYNATDSYDIMKIRLENSSLSATTTLTQIENKNHTKIDKVTKDTTVYVNASAQSGNDGVGGIYTVSALVFDKDGNFAYYRPLESAKGSGLYAFDLTGIPAGKYRIGIVNEAYNENSTIPTDSSSISDVQPLEIVEPLSDLSFTPNNDLQFNQNVNVGDKVGSITSKNGAGSPQYKLIEDTAYPGEADQLEISNDGTGVVVKNSALHAGTYHFKIQAQDGNGNPSTPLEITASITVKKASLTIAFDNPNQVKKSITDASVSWLEKATANPKAGTKITYAKSGGTIGLIDIDPDSGAIKYIGNGSFGKVVIKAMADDDPGTGNDDYQSAETTKEIVIFREISGSITPHANSSSTSTPTFQTSDANIKPNGVIGKIIATLGTPNNGTSGETTYTYGLKQVDDYNYFSVNTSTGEIKTTADLSSNIGNYNITVTVSDQWSTKEIPVNISVGLSPAENLKFYENSTSNTMITKKSAKVTDKNVAVYATVKGSSNNNPIIYKLKDGEPTNVIDVHPNSGAVTIKNVGTVVIVAEKQGASGQANAITELTFTVTAGSQEFIYTDASGNELSKSGNDYNDYSEVYGQGKTFQLYTTGNPLGTTVTYALKLSSPTDVLSVDPDGLVSVYNASLNTQIGQVIIEATSHDPNGNYADKTIELPINITKANQTISFSGVTLAQNGKGKVTPMITTQDISSNDGGVMVSDTNYYISVDASASGIAWTNNGIDVEYNYSGDTTFEIPLHVEKAGNRNYNKVEADGKMKILSPSESTLSINQPGKIYYGDHFTLRSLQDDSSSNNVQYTFIVDNTIFVSNPTVNGNMAEFDALKCSNGAKINITVTRTADSEVTLSKKITIEVLPKDINVIIDDKTKEKGEENPELTFQDFTSQLVSWNGVQDVVDSSIVKLSTTATKESKSGSYPITGNTKTMNTTYPNYNFIFKEGKLMIDSDIDKDVDGDGKPDFNDPDGDDCPDLNIKWKDDSGNWIVINGDRDDDGIPDLNIDSDGDGMPDLNIDTDNDGKPDINLVILKKSDWKPTKCVTVNSTVKEEYCTGTSLKPQINIDTDNDNIPNINIDHKGDFKPHINISKDGKAPAINIAVIHTWKPDKDYKKNNFSYDTMEINEKKEVLFNIDTDGDGRPDVNIDFDGDGQPDINIDTDFDWIPNIDIDTTGNGKADTNLDTDHDGEPDENIIEINEWKPNKDGNKDGLPFDTMEIKQKTELEDNGVKVEKPDGTPFLPNFALKVEDVTDIKQAEIIVDAKDFINETNEVKKVYDVKLLKDGVEVQPDGTLKIKIPYDNIKNPILIRKNADGTYEKIEYKIEGEYLTYETDALGIVSIIGDKEFETSVKGTYTPNIGGAITGDETNVQDYMVMMIGGLFILLLYEITNKNPLKRN